MIYKNPMQVKEIPIVFRGSVPAANTVREYDKTSAAYNKNITYVSPNGLFNSYMEQNVSASWNTDLYIMFNGEYYGLVEKYNLNDGDGGYYPAWGAPETEDEDFDFSEYPFVFYLNSTPMGTVLMSFSNAPGPVELVIWTTEPNYTETTFLSEKVFSADITGNGQVQSFNVRFALGENGTLRIKPYVILNGNIRVNLADFAAEGDQYIAGDNETVSFDCFVPVETHAKICVEAENIGAYASILDAWAVVQYEDYIEEETIIGYEGRNMGRRR